MQAWDVLVIGPISHGNTSNGINKTCISPVSIQALLTTTFCVFSSLLLMPIDDQLVGGQFCKFVPMLIDY